MCIRGGSAVSILQETVSILQETPTQHLYSILKLSDVEMDLDNGLNPRSMGKGNDATCRCPGPKLLCCSGFARKLPSWSRGQRLET